MPLDKSPGPDGFNGNFLRKCWPLIKTQFYKLCDDFYAGKLDLHSINTTYITLIPKHQEPEPINDYRPISLVSLTLKFLTKILANRLQDVIIPLIHKNQYGFIKGRTIHDILAWAFEYIHLCHKSKNEIIIVKIDFEKAFDKVEYSAILRMLKQLGFGSRWLGWIGNILSSASTSVLLNGVPGKLSNVKELLGRVTLSHLSYSFLHQNCYNMKSIMPSTWVNSPCPWTTRLAWNILSFNMLMIPSSSCLLVSTNYTPSKASSTSFLLQQG